MTRLVPIAVLLLILPAAAWSQTNVVGASVVSPESWQTKVTEVRYALPDYSADTGDDSPDRTFAGTEVSPNTKLGLGVIGPKRGSAAMPPVTVYEVNTRQTRKAGVGFSLKF